MIALLSYKKIFPTTKTKTTKKQRVGEDSEVIIAWIITVQSRTGGGSIYDLLGRSIRRVCRHPGESKPQHLSATTHLHNNHMYGAVNLGAFIKKMWKNFDKPLKSGALYMTEFCSKEPERRGIAINRWLHAVLLFCRYQKDAEVQKQNAALLNSEKCKELYAEIDRIMPSLEYCLAPKKAAEKTGAASLRSGVSTSQEASPGKDPGMLDTHAKTLYEWLDTAKVSGCVCWFIGTVQLVCPSLQECIIVRLNASGIRAT